MARDKLVSCLKHWLHLLGDESCTITEGVGLHGSLGSNAGRTIVGLCLYAVERGLHSGAVQGLRTLSQHDVRN